MIMFRDQPQDEGHPTFQSLEDLNQSLQQRRDAYNTAPQDELGGLSPEQVARLIYTDWEIQGEKQKTAIGAAFLVSSARPPFHRFSRPIGDMR